jgi:hypothetical protein
MRTYEITIVVSLVVLFIALTLLNYMMRRQVHEARFGSEEISPWDVRFVNDLFGESGIWNSRKRLYQRSRLRLWLVTLSIAFLICLAVGACVFLYAHA